MDLPNRHRGPGNATGAQGRAEEFRRHGPRDWTPADTEDDHVQVEERKGTLGLCAVRGPRVSKKLNQNSNNNHADGRPDGAEDEQGLPAKTVDQEEADDSSGQLRDVDDAGLDELLLVGEAKCRDHGRSVVDQRVDADHLLEETHEDGDQGAAPAAGPPGVDPRPEVELDLVLEAASLKRGVALDLDLARDPVLGPHAKPLSLDKDVVGAATVEPRERRQGLVVAALHGEPSRAGGHGEGADEEDDSRDHLQAKGDAERGAAGEEPRAEAGPVRDHDAKNDKQLVQVEKHASHIRGCDLADVDRHGTREQADAQAADETARDDGVVVHGARLDGRADEEEEASHAHGHPPREVVRDVRRGEGAHEGAQLEEGRHQALVEPL